MNREDLSTKNLKSVQKLHWGVFRRVKQSLDDVMRDGKILCGVLQRRILALAVDKQHQSTLLTDHTHLCQLTHFLQHSTIRWHQHLQTADCCSDPMCNRHERGREGVSEVVRV